jgi:hypothetical protein
MNPLDQLTLEAFRLALERLEDALPEDLAQKIQAVSHDHEAHINDIRDLVTQFAPLQTEYQAAREELQSQSADRKQFLASRNYISLEEPDNQPKESNPLGSTQVSEQNSNKNSNANQNPQLIIQPRSGNGTHHSNSSPALPPSPQPQPSAVPPSESNWDRVDRIAIMASGGAFLGGAIVQLFGGGITQLVGAVIGAIVGAYSGHYLNSQSQTRRKF